MQNLAQMNEKRITWDNHEKLNVLTTSDGLIISYKHLENDQPDHKVLKQFYKPFGKESIHLEAELTKDVKEQRKKTKKELKFLKDGTIDFQQAPDHFLFERIASSSENNLIAAKIEALSKDFENGYEINIGMCGANGRQLPKDPHDFAAHSRGRTSGHHGRNRVR